MDKVRVVATAEHQYFGHRHLRGDEYDCAPQHIEPFEKLGWVRRKDDGAPRADQTYQTRDLVAGAGESLAKVTRRLRGARPQ